MTVIDFNLANIAPFTNGETSVLFGKNGFATTVGEIRLLCNSVSTVGNNIRFSVPALDNCFDENFYKHVLAVNDSSLFPNRIKGFDYVAFPINEKSPDAFVENFSAFRPLVTQYSNQIVSYSTANSYIEIVNSASQGDSLLDKLPETPFFVSINQLVEKNLTANNSVYITGNKRKVVKENSVTGISSTAFNQPLGVTPIDRTFIKVYVDGLLDDTFQYVSGTSYVTVNLNSFKTPGATTAAEKIRTEVDHYSAPVIEVGDNISIASGNIYVVANTSYDANDIDYNVSLTANTVYRVRLSSSPRANLTGRTATNITQDPIGVVSNVTATTGTKGTLSFGYSSISYPGVFNLANTGVYNLSSTAPFEDIFFGNQREKIVRDLPIGLTMVRARNVNSAKRKSPFNTQTTFIRNIPIPRVQNLEVTEGLFIDAIRGVSLRATIKFDKIFSRDVTDYEIAYKLQGATRTTSADDKNVLINLTNFNSVKIPNNSASIDGGIEKISFTINNLDRGPRNNPNSILVRVTPLNGEIRGISVEKTVTLAGKRTPPLAPKQFQVGQILDNLVFVWQLERDSSGSLRDLDLEKIEIRRVSEQLDPKDVSTLAAKFPAGTLIATAAAPTSTITIPVPTYVTSTYMAQAIDTSGNKSTVVGVVYTPAKPADLSTYQAYSEDNPDLNYAYDYKNELIVNTNLADEAFHGNYPSQNTRTGGLSIDNIIHLETSTAVDNANGFASGWSAVSDVTDLQATANAEYVTQVRDVGSVIQGKVLLDVISEPFSSDRWTGERGTVITSATEPSNFPNVLVDRNVSGTIGSPTANGIGEYLQLETPHGVLDVGESSVVFDSLINQTITSASGTPALDLTTEVSAAQFRGSVYAVWNPGQFAGDISNANSFALIAGIVNANAIALGQGYYANGNPIYDSSGKLAGEVGADHSVTNVLLNVQTISAGVNYELVDLNQYTDDTESTFAGVDPSLINQNVQVRYSTDNPFFANSNVDITTFSTNTATRDGYVDVSGFDKEFRYFQVRLKVENSSVGKINYNLNQLRYTVDLKDKIFIRSIAVSGENQSVDYSSAKFLAVPFVNGQIINAAAGSYTIIMRSITASSCTVSIYDETGAVVTGNTIQFEARGI